MDEGRPVAQPELDRGRFEAFVGRAAAAVPGIDSVLKRLDAGHDLRGDKGAVAARRLDWRRLDDRLVLDGLGQIGDQAGTLELAATLMMASPSSGVIQRSRTTC